jgi:hypothetical protein
MVLLAVFYFMCIARMIMKKEDLQVTNQQPKPVKKKLPRVLFEIFLT